MINETKRTLYLAFVSASARAPAFLVPILIAAFFGAGVSTDAYFIAYSAVLFLGGTVAQGVEQAIVPFAARQVHLRDGTARWFLDHAALRTAAVAAALWIVGVPVFVIAAAPGLGTHVLRYAASFTPLALAWCAAAVFGGALVSQWKIASATGSMLWRGLGALLGMALVPLGAGLWTVALGLGVGEIYRFWWLRERVFRDVSPNLQRMTAALKPLAHAALAQVAASAAIVAAPVIERLLAARLGVGAVSHLEYAMRLLVIPATVFEGALVPLQLAQWTHQITTEGREPTKGEVLRVVWRGSTLAALFGVVLAAFAPELVHVLLAHGRFGPADEEAVASLLRLLSVAFVGNMTAQLLERHYIAMTRNRALAALSLGRAIVRLGLALSLLDTLGLRAFAIGFAVSDWCYVLALVGLLRPVGGVPTVTVSRSND